MDEITSTLSESDLQRLRAAYGADPGGMEGLLIRALPAKHRRTKPYIDVLHRLFHDSVDDRGRPPEGASAILGANRERCIIALLAARGSQRNLALHIYMGLMLGISPEEIGDVIFLTAVYSGTPAMADGLNTAVATLQVLARVAAAETKPGVEAVLKELIAFPL